MPNSAISQGLARQIERSDIHHKVEKLTNIQGGYPSAVAEMIQDLKSSVPELSIRQLSVLVGVSNWTVQKALDNTVPEERWTEEDNPASAAAELAALHEHHPGQGYIDDEDALKESTAPVLFTAPAFHDPYRRADQSHTIRRPITLATRPYEVAA